MNVKKTANIRKVFCNLLSLIITILLSVSVFFPVFADGRASVELSYSGRYPRTMRIEGNKLTIEQIPSTEKFSYIWLQLIDKNGQKAYSHIYKNDSGSLSFYLSNISNGKYSVNLFTAAERYTMYKSILYGQDVEHIWQDTSGSFESYPYYGHNTSVFSSKRGDEKALEYYRQPSYNIQSDNQEIIDLAANITRGIDNDYDKAVQQYLL